MSFLPLFFNLEGRKVLIIGGGTVALRKVRMFHEAGADIHVMAPDILKEISEIRGIQCRLAPARPSDISREYDLVILTTNQPELQKKLAATCRRKKIPFNRCDDPADSIFVTGAVIRLPPIVTGIMTSGSPTISLLIKQRVEKVLDPALIQLGELMNEIRPVVLKKISDISKRESFFRKWATETTVNRVKKVGIRIIRKEMQKALTLLER